MFRAARHLHAVDDRQREIRRGRACRRDGGEQGGGGPRDRMARAGGIESGRDLAPPIRPNPRAFSFRTGRVVTGDVRRPRGRTRKTHTAARRGAAGTGAWPSKNDVPAGAAPSASILGGRESSWAAHRCPGQRRIRSLRRATATRQAGKKCATGPTPQGAAKIDADQAWTRPAEPDRRRAPNRAASPCAPGATMVAVSARSRPVRAPPGVQGRAAGLDQPIGRSSARPRVLRSPGGVKNAPCAKIGDRNESVGAARERGSGR